MWQVRKAEVRDISDLLLIEEAQFPEPWSRRMLREEIENGATRRYTVVQDGGRVVGVLGLMFIEDDAHINTIATAPDMERRGIGRILLDDGLAAAIRRGSTRMTLEVAVGNEAARAFYSGYGFAPLGVRKQYYQKTGEDALVLVKYFDGG
ncbi:MAG: ribosomal protein S18-alanine N-acetyltransferase [Actinomycetes bacterium]